MSEDPTILSVAEDQDARSLFADLLREARYAVATASTAAAAVAAVESGDVDAVVAAHDLPDDDGIELLDRIDGTDVPVLLCPSAGDERLAGRALAAGAAGYLPRRDADAELVDRVRGLLDEPEGATERDIADEEHNRLSLLIEQSPLAIVEWTTEFAVAGWNPAAEELFGYGEAEAMGRVGPDLIVPDDERGDVEEIWRGLIGDGEVTHTVNENVTKSGDRITCEWHNAPLTDDDGRVVGGLSFVRDVTERVQRVAALETLQEMSRNLIGSDTRRDVAEVVTDAAADVLNQPLAAFRLYDTDADALELVASLDDDWDADALAPLGRDDGPLWRAFESGRQTVYEDAGAFESVDSESLLVQPLGDHGLLSFGADRPDAFDETDRHLATVVGVAVEAALDRTERKRELERRETLLDAVGDGLYALDAEGRYTELNDTVASMTGYDREELLGEHVSTLMLEEDVERGRELVRRLLDDDGPDVVSYEMTVVARDGEEIPCETNLSLLPGEEFTGSVGTVRDVSERKRMERKLREERDRFAALFENVPDPVASVRQGDEQSTVIDVNPAFERVFGYDAEQLRGESINQHIVPPENRDRASELDARGASGELIETEVKRQTATGLRDFVLTVVPVDIDEGGTTTYGVYTDVTERNRQQKRVEVLNRVLRHDLRNGMNIVKGCAEMLDARVEDGSEYAATIQERADELIALAEKTRAVERTLARDDADPGSVDVVAAVRDIAERVDAEFDDVDLTTSLPDSAYALADSMLRTAIYHVVENAIVHNDGDRPSVSVDVSVDERDQRVEIAVGDDGPGIPTEERELLAEDREITQLRHASGLGLWLVNWVVTQSGGELSFEETAAGGTRVLLDVPMARVEQRPA